MMMSIDRLQEKLMEFVKHYVDEGYFLEVDGSAIEERLEMSVWLRQDDYVAKVEIQGVSYDKDKDTYRFRVDFKTPPNQLKTYINEIMETFTRITGIPTYSYIKL